MLQIMMLPHTSEHACTHALTHEGTSMHARTHSRMWVACSCRPSRSTSRFRTAQCACPRLQLKGWLNSTGASTHGVEVRGERLNGRLEALYCFQSILEKTGGEKKQRVHVTREKAVRDKTVQGKAAGQGVIPGGTETFWQNQNKMTKL